MAKFRAFGERCFRYVDIKQRSNVDAAAEAVTYLFPASYCPFLDKLVDIPKGHVVINSKGNLVVSGQLRFMDSSGYMELVPPEHIAQFKQSFSPHAQDERTVSEPNTAVEPQAPAVAESKGSQPTETSPGDDTDALGSLRPSSHDPYAITTRRLKHLKHLAISFTPGRHKKFGSQSQTRLENYSKATTIGQYLQLGGTNADFMNDLEQGILRFVDDSWQRSANDLFPAKSVAAAPAQIEGEKQSKPIQPAQPSPAQPVHLYGLKQSPQLWNKHLNHLLHTLGFTRAHGDSCIYYHQNPSTHECTYIATEVDDLVITGNDAYKIHELRVSLERSYIKEGTSKTELDWDNPIRSFLGIDINYDQDQGTLSMNVTDKVVKLETKFPWLSRCSTSQTPSLAADDTHSPDRGSTKTQQTGPS